MAYQTFEERQGRGLPLQIAIPGCLPMRFRRIMHRAFQDADYKDSEYRAYLIKVVDGFYERVNYPVLHGEGIFKGSTPDSHFEEALGYIRKVLHGKGTNRWGEEAFMHDAEGYPESVINFLDYVLYHEEPAGKGLCDRIQEVFDNNPTAYAVRQTQNDEGRPVRKICAAMGKHSASKLRDALERIEVSNAKRVQNILWDADKLLNKAEYTSAVNEGYAAVEYAAKQLAKQRKGHSGNTLNSAIRNLITTLDQNSFPASILEMVEIMSKYGNHGNRHKLDIPINTTREDAVMYLGVCAMAADWLISQMIEQPIGEGE